eukprot:TRINITY_DN3892_c0_g1_i4.p1 TRINITY_DN3892_c0_g1~~TRINITY_DN3892_c0_g1_i4.p1  ORF type:complete len:171 (+),score=34.61 TRINITY_DN3892_c0_g1_i4:176-688(+)
MVGVLASPGGAAIVTGGGPNASRSSQLSGHQNGQQRGVSGSVLDLLEKIDPEKARQLREEQSELADVVATLKSVKDAFEDQGKELARQKIEFIKAKIDAHSRKEPYNMAKKEEGRQKESGHQEGRQKVAQEEGNQEESGHQEEGRKEVSQQFHIHINTTFGMAVEHIMLL